MKKLIPLLIIAAGSAVVYVSKKLKDEKLQEKNEEIKLIQLKNEVDIVSEENKTESEILEDIQADENENDDSLNKEETTLFEKSLVAARFPYLSNETINNAYEYYDTLVSSVNEFKTLTVVHVARFTLVEDLVAYVKWVKKEGYSLRDVDNENYVMACKQTVLADPNFVEDIFVVANIVAGFKGEYQGFSVENID